MALLRIAAVAALSALCLTSAPQSQKPPSVTQGALLVRGRDATAVDLECPLKHTDVKAEISGFLARVTVTQDFVNSAKDKVEAVYVFPLPHNAAVDDMTLHVGERVIKGQIKRRAEANAMYEAAKNAGNVAALLDQERPNIFTQRVANIEPGAKVRVMISYTERLGYEAGTYQFTFPMVVGPRYNPISVSDANRISPPVARPDQRIGHDIAVEVKLDAGVPLDALSSPSHPVNIERPTPARALVKLRDQDTIPNKDFVLKYDVAGRKIANAVLAHRDSRGGFFSLILQPPERVAPAEITPKEIVFVLDTSGSMHGFPIEKAKESMRLALNAMNPRDTFNVITFSGDTEILFPTPVPASRENLALAERFLAGQRGRGGTEMMKAIRAALDPSDAQDHIRVVCFMTDGYVGNDADIIEEIRRHPKARVFSFGIGNSVNRYLLDNMAEAGRGEVEYVSLEAEASAAAKRFHERVNSPLLTDIRIDWNGLPVEESLPAQVPDLFAAKPIVVTGRYSRPAKGSITLHGLVAGKPYTASIPVDLPATADNNTAIATLWARTKVDQLSNTRSSDPAEQITKLGLDFRLMTPYTSFVAVEETRVTEGGVSRRVEVPVAMPEGVSYEGVFGDMPVRMAVGVQPLAYAQSKVMITGGGIGGGTGGNTVREVPAVPSNGPRAAILYKPAPTSPMDKVEPALRAQTGRLRVHVAMANRSPEVLKKLARAGAELVQVRPAGVLILRVDAANLLALASIDEVLWIGPEKEAK